MSVRFAIADKIYDAITLERVTLADMLLFEQHTADFGRALSWAQISDWIKEIKALPAAQRGQHPGQLWIIASMIWASRRGAGEQLTFAEAVNIPMGDLKWLPETADRKKPPTPTKAAPRKASGRAAASRRAKPAASSGRSRATSSARRSASG